ncbi:metallophosphoesterase family protein [Dyadobacter psychrotolerans]|uniref:Metallophosphoesterase n=1 Tax=Dyadobacter psychrotolerans TaxID=2541721 RepID=A0A4V2Z2I9_9BACT|nr:metallophosphoesterase [Dyadobacter psychrotolerans]TDE09018.1 metallophosphoesterase [Dyadobacter psychrotolerans]
MRRRDFLANGSLAAALAGTPGTAADADRFVKNKPVLTLAHITDVHLRPQEQITSRFKRCLHQVKKHKIDFVLNGGDSIFAADYKDVTRESMLAQWASWDECIKTLAGYQIYSCIGNHDPWWQAASKEDEMYGVNYVAKRVGIPHRYYSFTQKNWHFIILDGNNPGIKLDAEQMSWLEKELDAVAQVHYVLLMSHYPILSVTAAWTGGAHADHVALRKLFYKHKDKVRVCLSGHNHLLDSNVFNGVHYFCNGAMSGYWWEKGNEQSAGPYFYEETAPGYAILRLYADGSVDNQYYEHHI